MPRTVLRHKEQIRQRSERIAKRVGIDSAEDAKIIAGE